ncbi:MAG: hypothetical protein AABY22_23285 [Nanoarchaeota archaeon]
MIHGKKGLEPITLTVLAFILVGTIIVGGLVKQGYMENPLNNIFSKPLVISGSPGCQFVPDPSNPNSPYSEIKSSISELDPGLSYICSDGECVVKGGMVIEKKESALKKVIYRTNILSTNYNTGTWIAYDTGDNKLSPFVFSQKVEETKDPNFYSTYYKKLPLKDGSILFYIFDSNIIYISKGETRVQTTTIKSYKYCKSNLGDVTKQYQCPPGIEICPYGSSPTVECSSRTESKTYYIYYKYILQSSSNIILSPNTPVEPYSSSNQEEYLGEVEQDYKAYFNFCPQGVSFDFCSPGLKNTINSEDVTTVSTDEYKLNGQIKQSVSFTPKYPNEQYVAKKTLYVKKYDCSCLPNLASSPNKYCDSSQGKVYCKPQISCPVGYTFFTQSSYCGGSSDSNLRYGYYGNVCRTSQSSNICKEQTLKNDNFQLCNGKETQSTGAICSIWSTTNTCLSGQQCIVDSTNKTGEGIGGCRCPTDQCSAGTKIKTGERTYKICSSTPAGCNAFIDTQCASGLIFDDTSKKCVIDPTTYCNPLDKECVGITQIKECISTSINDPGCFNGVCVGNIWASNPSDCPAEKSCKVNITTTDSCSCDNKCIPGSIKCVDQNSYKSCTIGNTGCYQYRDPATNVQPDTICDLTTNSLKTKPGCIYHNPDCSTGLNCNPNTNTCENVGCKYNTPGYDCSTQKDLNGNLLESCSIALNKCVLNADLNIANFSDIGYTRCSLSTPIVVQKVSTYNSSTNTIYRWETKTDAENSNNGLCNSPDYTCYQGQCILSYSDVGIISKGAYGIGEKIKNITVHVTSSLGNNVNINVDLELLDKNGIPIKNSLGFDIGGGQKLQTNPEGKAFFDFDYAHQKVDALILKAIVYRPNAPPITFSKNITIGKSLDVEIVCPTDLIVGREVTCYIKVIDSLTNQVLTTSDISSEIKIQQGTTDLTYSTVGITGSTTGIKFIPLSAGAITITSSASKGTEYLSDTQISNIEIQDPTVSSNLLIDNKAYSSYGSAGISTGIHSLTVKIDESGVPIEAIRIEGQIIPPSGVAGSNIRSGVPLTFRRISAGVYESSYDFQTAGQTYDFSANVYLSGKPTLAISGYKITTLGSTTGKEQSRNLLYIVLGAVTLIFLIIIVVLVIRTRKRR